MNANKNKNITIIWLVINVLLFLTLIFLLLMYFYPQIMDIEFKKEKLAEQIEKYNNINTKGLPYSEFKKIRNPSISIYEQKILSKIDKDFYDKNFLNKDNKFSTYLDFLDSLEKEINGELKDDYSKKHDKIFSVLPIYTENSENSNPLELTDFKFVNLIENLLYDYDLISESSLGIKEISKLETYSNKSNSDLSSDIYVIKLPLTIEGKKKNLIAFLKHIKEMGKVKICSKKDVINTKKTGCESEGQLLIDNPSIFTELGSISMDKYIDSSTYINIDDKDKDLIYLLTKTPQKNELFKMDITLLFYVQGLPNYKLKDFINQVIGKLPKSKISKKDEKSEKDKELEKLSKTNFFAIKDRLVKLKTKYKNNKLISQQLEELYGYLTSINKDINKINREISKTKDLMSIYNKVEKYKGIFTLISNKLDQIESNAKK